MDLTSLKVSDSYQFLLVKSGDGTITLGNGDAVNWTDADVVDLSTNQDIVGAKNFSEITAYFLNGIQQSYLNGNYDNGTNNFGYQSIAAHFGQESQYNTFGNEAYGSNEFGSYAVANLFGEYSYNFFGRASSSNIFGESSSNNGFGLYSINNQFGISSEINSFGLDSQLNYFGSLIGQNECLGTFIFSQTGRMRLANFTGSSSQSGLRGEARVSGTYLYICTGTTGSWGRIQLSNF
jgi:hypothetical protein